MPGATELDCVAGLARHFLGYAEALLERAAAQNTLPDADVHRVVGSVNWAARVPMSTLSEGPPLNSTTRDVERGLPPYVRLAPRYLGPSVAQLDDVRPRIAKLYARLDELLRRLRPESADSFSFLARGMLSFFSLQSDHDIRERARKQWKSKTHNHLQPKCRSRWMALWKADNYVLQLRSLWECEDTETSRQMLGILVEIALGEYAVAREAAQGTLGSVLHKFPLFTHQLLIPRVLGVLRDAALPSTTEAQLKGALYLMSSPIIMQRICSKVKHLRPFLTALCGAHAVDKPTVQTRVTGVFAAYVALAPANPLQVAIGPSVAGAALEHLQRVNRAMEEGAAGLEADLLRLGSGQLHWRYELMLCVALTMSLRKGHPVSPARCVWFAQRLTSDVASLRTAAAAALSMVLQLETPKPKREWTVCSEAPLLESGPEFFDRPWEGFTGGGPFRHKRYRGEPPPHSSGDALRAVRAVLEAPGCLERFLALCVLDHQRSGDSSGSKGPGGLSFQQMGDFLQRLGGGVSSLQARDIMGRLGVGGAAGGEGSASGLALPLSALAKRWPLTFHSASKGMFSIQNALLWKALFKAFGPAFGGEPLRAEATRLATVSLQREDQVVTMELVAGWLRAAKHAPPAEVEALLQSWLLPLLRDTLPNASSDSSFDWSCCIRFAVYHRDPRRLASLNALLLGLPAAQQSSSFALAKCLRYVEALVVEYDWRGQKLWGPLLAALRPLLGHEYKQVRLAVASLLHCFCCLASGEPAALGELLDEGLAKMAEDK